MSEAGAVAEDEAAPYYVGKLSLRSVRQAVRCLCCCVAAVGLWTVTVLGFLNSPWQSLLTWLICGLFGGVAFLFTLVALGFLRGLVTGGVFEQTIDKQGIRAWNPVRIYSVPRAAIDGISPSRRFLSARVDVCVTIRTWRYFNGPLQLWTDDGMTREEFDDLYDDLVSRGFG